MFIVFVAFFVVLVVGAVAFTDVVEEGVGGMRSAVQRALRSLKVHAGR